MPVKFVIMRLCLFYSYVVLASTPKFLTIAIKFVTVNSSFEFGP